MSLSNRSEGCHGLVLAAGAAQRFGGAKLLAPFRDQPLVTWTAKAALAAKIESVTVVVGAAAGAVEDALLPLAQARLRSVRCVDWQDGLSASLRCGLANLPTDCRAVLIFLADMPNVSAQLGDKALELVLKGAPAAWPVFAGMPGHPVAISADLFAPLQRLEGDRGARTILAGLRGIAHIETTDVGCIQDVDTQDDLRGLF